MSRDYKTFCINIQSHLTQVEFKQNWRPLCLAPVQTLCPAKRLSKKYKFLLWELLAISSTANEMFSICQAQITQTLFYYFYIFPDNSIVSHVFHIFDILNLDFGSKGKASWFELNLWLQAYRKFQEYHSNWSI